MTAMFGCMISVFLFLFPEEPEELILLYATFNYPKDWVICEVQKLEAIQVKAVFSHFYFPGGTGRIDFDDFIYCFMLHLITG